MDGVAAAVDLSNKNVDARMVVWSEPSGIAAEQFRVLHLRIDRLRRERPCAVIAVTSARPGEGKTVTVANLAACAANGGRKVLLIDGDVRRSQVAKLLGLDDIGPGTVDVLLGRASVGQALRLGTQGLWVLPGGVAKEEPARVFSDGALEHLLARLRAEFQEIYLDLPPALFADALVGTAAADGVIVVVQSGKTDADEVRQLVDALGASAVIGCVLTGADEAADAYRDYRAQR